jgi:hypothetical protein
MRELLSEVFQAEGVRCSEGVSIQRWVGGEATKAEQGGFDPTDLGISPLSKTNGMVGKSPKPVLRHWYIYALPPLPPPPEEWSMNKTKLASIFFGASHF